MKRTSKRRWIARFQQGKMIPATAINQYPELARRLTPAIEFDYSNMIRRAALTEETGGGE